MKNRQRATLYASLFILTTVTFGNSSAMDKREESPTTPKQTTLKQLTRDKPGPDKEKKNIDTLQSSIKKNDSRVEKNNSKSLAAIELMLAGLDKAISTLPDFGPGSSVHGTKGNSEYHLAAIEKSLLMLAGLDKAISTLPDFGPGSSVHGTKGNSEYHLPKKKQTDNRTKKSDKREPPTLQSPQKKKITTLMNLKVNSK